MKTCCDKPMHTNIPYLLVLRGTTSFVAPVGCCQTRQSRRATKLTVFRGSSFAILYICQSMNSSPVIGVKCAVRPFPR